MKPIFFALLLTAIISLSFHSKDKTNPLPLCAAINKVLADEGKDYSSLKGEALDTNDDGSENFTLKITFDGFSSNQYVKGKDGAYVEIFNEHPTKTKATAQFNAVVKQLETCLGVKGESVEQEGLDHLYVVTKGKSEIAVIGTTTETKSIIIITIEKAKEE